MSTRSEMGDWKNDAHRKHPTRTSLAALYRRKDRRRANRNLRDWYRRLSNAEAAA